MSFERYYTANDMESAPPPYNQGPYIPMPTMPPDLGIPHEGLPLCNDATKADHLYDSYQGTFYIKALPIMPEDTKSHSIGCEPAQTPTPPPTKHPLPSREIQDPILAQTTSWIPPTAPPPSTHFLRLETPVIVPRLNTTHKRHLPLPFVRCYAPILASHDITAQDFASFVDNLAVAQAAPLPLQVLDVAGAGMGLAGRSAAKARTARFLEACNERFFGPRGLKAGIARDEDVARMLRVGMWEDALAPVDKGCVGLRERRMKALEPYVAPLSFDVPPSTVQRNVLDRLSARQIESRVAKAERKEREKAGMMVEKDGKKRRDSMSSDESGDFESEMRKLDRRVQLINLKAEEELDEKGLRKKDKIEGKRRKEVNKVEEEREKLMQRLDAGSEKGDKDSKAKARELDMVAQMEYIVIENL